MPANDGTPDGWYGLIDANGHQVGLATRRLAYDFQDAADAMRRHGYANAYARALCTGLWPSLDVLPPLERSAAGHPLETCAVVFRARAQAQTARRLRCATGAPEKRKGAGC